MTQEEIYKAQSIGVIDSIQASLPKLNLHCTRHIITQDQLREIKALLVSWTKDLRDELNEED